MIENKMTFLSFLSENMYNNIASGKVRIQATSNWYSMRTRHLPIYNDGFAGQFRLCTSIY